MISNAIKFSRTRPQPVVEVTARVEFSWSKTIRPISNLCCAHCAGKIWPTTKEDHPRLILLDPKLPKVDGIEVLRQLKSAERTKTIPVVMPVDFEQFGEMVANAGLYPMLMNRMPE